MRGRETAKTKNPQVDLGDQLIGDDTFERLTIAFGQKGLIMAFSLSPLDLSKPARYMLVHRVQRENTLVGPTTKLDSEFRLYCETWADVVERLRFNISATQQNDDGFSWVNKPSQWKAHYCKHICKRMAFNIAMQRMFDESGQTCFGVWYVVALK